MISIPRGVDAPARLLMALLFLVSGAGKLGAVTATQAYMAAFGVPVALVWLAAAWEIAAGILLVLGLWTRPLAIGLAGWCVLTALIFHTAFADQNQLMNFLKNLTMAGAFLLIARGGTTAFSLDHRLATRRERQGQPARSET